MIILINIKSIFHSHKRIKYKVGCKTCSRIDKCSWLVTCDQCKPSFHSIKTTCGTTQYYCGCSGNTYPDTAGNCNACNSVIPFCLSCGTNQFIGTYCSTCDTGSYKIYVWYDHDDHKWRNTSTSCWWSSSQDYDDWVKDHP